MAWLVGIDEAGYGPNLGPFVMSAVACRVPDHCCDADLWQVLSGVAGRCGKNTEAALVVDDSKLVYVRLGLAGLERGIRTTLWREEICHPGTLGAWIEQICPEGTVELQNQVWYRGQQTLPVHPEPMDFAERSRKFSQVCAGLSVGPWHFRSVVVCPFRFNALMQEGRSKGYVLAHALIELLRWQHVNLNGEDNVLIFIDKHGGRNTYAAMIQQALPDGSVIAERESMECSAYRLQGLDRTVCLRFQPRADSAHLCVALASMASKYLRELLMLEFNRFWLEHVPSLRPTAGYPGDAARFYRDIEPVVEKLGLPKETLWRYK